MHIYNLSTSKMFRSLEGSIRQTMTLKSLNLMVQIHTKGEGEVAYDVIYIKSCRWECRAKCSD